MSQPAADHSPGTVSRTAPPLLSERPMSELQRAVQMRALESIARQRAQASKRPTPLRRIATFALALIPVALLFIAVDGLLRVFHHMNDLYNSPSANAAAAQPAPAEEVIQSEPGVVMLLPPQELNSKQSSQSPSQPH